MLMVSGIKVTISRMLCQQEFVRWRKSHRKARINKKWHKRYGPVTVCKGHGYQVAGIGIVGCPCFVNKLRAQLSARSDPGQF